MSLVIKRGKDKRVIHALTRNLADLLDGVTVQVSELVSGTPIMEGAVIGRDSAGVAHLIKTASVVEVAGESATTYSISKGNHFKVGDYVCLTVGGAAYAITAIDRDTSTVKDTITLGTTLGAASVGAVLKQANAQATGQTTSKAVLKYTPEALLAESYDVEAGDNLFVAAVTMGQFKAALVPPIDASIKSALLNNGSFINFV